MTPPSRWECGQTVTGAFSGTNLGTKNEICPQKTTQCTNFSVWPFIFSGLFFSVLPKQPTLVFVLLWDVLDSNQ